VVYSGIQDISLDMPLTTEEIDLNGDMINDFAFYFKGYVYGSASGPYFFNSHLGLGAIMNPRTDGYNNSWITKSGQLSINYSNYFTSISTQINVPLVRDMEVDEIINVFETEWSNTNNMYVAGVLGYQRFVSYYNTPSSWGYVSFRGGSFRGDMKFVGVRFFIGSDIHYGWIRVRMNEMAQDMRIMDWAYEANPGIGIHAGDGGDLSGPVVSLEGAEEATPYRKTTLVVILDEFSRGLEISDFLVTNGEASNLFMLNPGLVYTLDIVAEDFGEVSVELPAGAIHDTFGYENESVSLSWEYFDASLMIEAEADKETKIYPNPAGDVLIIETEAESSIRLINIEGKVIFDKSGNNRHILDVSNLKTGIYILREVSKNHSSQHRVIIQHE
jgi:hypothetical protein